MLPTVHIPVLFQEVIEHANVSAGSIVLDGTLGGGGHALQLLRLIVPGGTLVGIDRDAAAIERARGTFATAGKIGSQGEQSGAREGSEWHLLQGSYADAPELLAELGIQQVDLILLDLGLSSDQLQDRERGFSFREESPLDLRFDPTNGTSAADLLAYAKEKEIADWIYQYGEERFSRRIAKAIVERRRTEPIRTTKQLSDLVHRCVPGPNHGRIDKATRTFQALRIVVNAELEHLEKALQWLPNLLRSGGRMMVISFHSLEDRPVKTAFRNDPRLENLTKKPIVASDSELHQNPRSRSAKLRIAARR